MQYVECPNCHHSIKEEILEQDSNPITEYSTDITHETYYVECTECKKPIEITDNWENTETLARIIAFGEITKDGKTYDLIQHPYHTNKTTDPDTEETTYRYEALAVIPYDTELKRKFGIRWTFVIPTKNEEFYTEDDSFDWMNEQNINVWEISGKDEGYNGWTNYETWKLVLWIDNDEDLHEEIKYQFKETGGIDEDTIRFILDIELEDYAKMYEDLSPIMRDLIEDPVTQFKEFLQKVNFKEITEHLEEEYREPEEV